MKAHGAHGVFKNYFKDIDVDTVVDGNFTVKGETTFEGDVDINKATPNLSLTAISGNPTISIDAVGS